MFTEQLAGGSEQHPAKVLEKWKVFFKQECGLNDARANLYAHAFSTEGLKFDQLKTLYEYLQPSDDLAKTLSQFVPNSTAFECIAILDGIKKYNMEPVSQESGLRPTSPYHHTQDPAPKIVIERCRNYMLYYLLTNIEAGQIKESNIKNCVTVASSELAFMAGHCLPKSCALGDKFTVYDNAGKPYPVELLYFDRLEQNGDDFAILKITDGKFPHYPSSISLPENGLPYFILGYDSEYAVDNLSCFNGHFRNTKVFVNRSYVIGSPGTTRGCSGAGVFNYTGSLYGICSSGRPDPTSNFMPFYDHLLNLHIRFSEPSYSHIIPAIYLMAKLSPTQKRKLEGGSPEDKKRSKQY